MRPKAPPRRERESHRLSVRGAAMPDTQQAASEISGICKKGPCRVVCSDCGEEVELSEAEWLRLVEVAGVVPAHFGRCGDG